MSQVDHGLSSSKQYLCNLARLRRGIPIIRDADPCGYPSGSDLREKPLISKLVVVMLCCPFKELWFFSVFPSFCVLMFFYVCEIAYFSICVSLF